MKYSFMQKHCLFLFFLFLLPLSSYGQNSQNPKDPLIPIRLLLQKANRHEQKREFKKATQCYQKILELIRKFPPSHQRYEAVYSGAVFLKMGECYFRMGQYEKALSYFQKGLFQFKRISNPSPSHLFYARNNIGEALFFLGKYRESLRVHKENLGELQKHYSSPHPFLAISWSNAGKALQYLGLYQDAYSFHQKALSIREKLYSPPHSHLVQSYNNLGSFFYEQGKYEEAISYYKKAMIQNRELGDQKNLALNFNNIAVAFKNMGRYEEALSHYQKALVIQEKLYPQDHPAKMVTCNNLAGLLSHLGRQREALKFYQKALNGCRALYKPPHPELATAYSNMGQILEGRGDFKKALAYFQQAYSQLEKLYKPPHPKLALVLGNLGTVYLLLGEGKKALAHHQKAHKQIHKLYTPPHPNLAIMENNLRHLLYELGRYGESEQYARRALEQGEKLYSPPHPQLALFYSNLSQTLLMEGKLEEAWALNEKGNRMALQAFQREWPLLSTQDKIRQTNRYFYDSLSLGICLAQKSQNTEWLQRAYEKVLFWKNLLVYILSREREIREQTSSGKIKNIYEKYMDLSRRLNSLAYRSIPIDPPKRKGMEERMGNLSGQVQEVERELSRESRSLSSLLKTPSFSEKKVREVLPPGSSLLEYICFYNYSKSERWVGVFLLKDREIQFFSLGSQKKISQSLLKILQQVSEDGSAYQRKLRDREEPLKFIQTAEGLLSEKTHGLFAALFPPSLQKALEGKKILFLSPDGPLHFLPFAILAIQKKPVRYFLEKWDHLYLSSGWGLLKKEAWKGRGFLGVGNPDYDFAAPEKGAVTSRGKGAVFLRGNQSPKKWLSLEGTAKEVEAAQNWYGLQHPGEERKILTEEKALKSSFAGEASKKKWLHIATHGFFLSSGNEEERGFQNKRLLKWFGEDENPLLLAGLVFAGANTETEGEKGYLSASDISLLDLRGTQCVVLSACETGKGKYLYGGGLFGFKWAFEHAGAHYLVSSLWKIPDRETLELMERFYKHLDQPAWKALLLAQREFLRKEQSRGKGHPCFWGAFTSQGNPLPLPEEKEKKAEEKAPGKGSLSGWIFALVAGIFLLMGLFIWWKKS